MTFKETFAPITAWQKENFPDATADAALIKFDEESLEFSAAVDEFRRADNPYYYFPKSEPTEERKERCAALKKNMGMELMDVMYCLNNFANKMGIDLDEMAALVKEKNDARKWKRNDDGTYSHIKT